MSWVKFELIALVISGTVWLIMWGLDIGGGTFQIGNTDVSIRLAVAAAVGAIGSFVASAASKRKNKQHVRYK